ncbi:hypothetical protein ACHHYP_10579 [Achlya hypogyna]|uniref:RNase NYN domain-containing protein n=1 Tax=Achlya hypogyna TaxID=1202772 RepID=A0A1V9YL36_ACHHY|nr:hypothetical protein ACHHYP_10579 [Achlya hypogyna]
MSEAVKNPPQPRARYRKKPPKHGTGRSHLCKANGKLTDLDDVSDPRLYVPEAAPRRSKANKHKARDAEMYDLAARLNTAASIDESDIVEQRKSRASHISKQREYRKALEDERKKREKAQSLMIQRVEEETVNKLVRAEVMYTLMQEHKQSKPKPSSPAGHDESYPYGFDPTGIQPDALLPLIKRWEEHLKRLLGGQRGSPHLSPIAAEHERGVACLRQACRDAYVELLLRHDDVVKRMELNERLWMNWYREIGAAQAAFSDAPTSLPVRDALAALLATSASFYHKLLGALQASHAAPFSVHMTLVALGDLSRYTQNLQPKVMRNWALAAVHYREALAQLPSNGKVYNQLALLALHAGDAFEASYLYSRSLACTTPFRARENLLTTLTKAADAARRAPPTAADGLDGFKAQFLLCLSVLYSGVDVVANEPAFAKCVELLAGLGPLAGEVNRVLLLQAMVFVIFAIHNTQVPVGAPEVQEPCFDVEWRPWREHEVVRHALGFGMRLCAVLLGGACRAPTDAVLHASLPGANVFLDWLRGHAWFLEFRDRSVPELQQQLTDAVAAVTARRDPALHDHWDGHRPPLPEDRELRGFLPYASVLARRCGPDAHVVNGGDGGVALALRATRLAGFVALAADLEWLAVEPRPAAPRPPAVIVDKLCAQCSNSISASPCEYCGHDDGADASDTSRGSSRGSTPRRGLLAGVNLAPSKAKRPKSAYGRPRAVPEFSGRAYASPLDRKCLIVVDAANVAMRHGLNKRFSCKGIRLVFDYYLERGHKVIAFLPDYLLQYESVGAQKRLAGVGYDVSPTKVPDDAMVMEGLVIATPPQDYDDSYCIQYAGRHDGCVVTNDLFRDHVDGMTGTGAQKAAMRQWLNSHRISFTWVGDEYFPNPDFRFPKPAEDQM